MICAVLLVTTVSFGSYGLYELNQKELASTKTEKVKKTNKKEIKGITIKNKNSMKKEEPVISEIIPETNTTEEQVIVPEVEPVAESVPVMETYINNEVYVEPLQDTNSNGTYVGTYSITAYTWTGNPMANGVYPYVGSAASCDFPLGTVVNIEGVGIYTINDVCPTSGVIDIYMNTYDECINFGRMNAKVYQ